MKFCYRQMCERVRDLDIRKRVKATSSIIETSHSGPKAQSAFHLCPCCKSLFEIIYCNSCVRYAVAHWLCDCIENLIVVKWDAHSHPKTERITRIRLRIFRMARALCICKILPLEIKHKPLSFSLPFELRKYFECGPFKLVRLSTQQIFKYSLVKHVSQDQSVKSF